MGSIFLSFFGTLFQIKFETKARILAMRPARAAGDLTYKKLFLLVFYYVLVASL